MSDGPTKFHLRQEAQKTIGANGGAVPPEVTPEMTQVALETSDVDLDALSQAEYDLLFNQTRARLVGLLAEVNDGT